MFWIKNLLFSQSHKVLNTQFTPNLKDERTCGNQKTTVFVR